MKEFSRRNFIIGSSALIAASFIGCNDRKDVFYPKDTNDNNAIDVLMANDGQVRIIDARDGQLFTKDIGINRVGLFRGINADRFHLFYEFTEDVVPIPAGTRRNDPDLKNISGLVPFDKSFDLEKAEDYAKKLKNDKATSNLDNAARIGNIFNAAGLKYGYISFELIPETGKDFMYYIGENFIYTETENGLQLSEPTILKAKIRFEGKPIPEFEKT